VNLPFNNLSICGLTDCPGHVVWWSREMPWTGNTVVMFIIITMFAVIRSSIRLPQAQ